jgi:hypothetical protein
VTKQARKARKFSQHDRLLSLLVLNPEQAKSALRKKSSRQIEYLRLNYPEAWRKVLEHIVFGRVTKISVSAKFNKSVLCMYRALMERQSFSHTWAEFHGGKRPNLVDLNCVDDWDKVETAFYSDWRDKDEHLKTFELENEQPTFESFVELLDSVTKT